MRILIVDDEERFALRLAERLRLRGFETDIALTGKASLGMFQNEHFDTIILDLRLPDMDGVAVLRQVMTIKPDASVVIISGHASETEFRTCLSLGARACFQKPVRIDDLLPLLS